MVLLAWDIAMVVKDIDRGVPSDRRNEKFQETGPGVGYLALHFIIV